MVAASVHLRYQHPAYEDSSYWCDVECLPEGDDATDNVSEVTCVACLVAVEQLAIVARIRREQLEHKRMTEMQLALAENRVTR